MSPDLRRLALANGMLRDTTPKAAPAPVRAEDAPVRVEEPKHG